MTTSASSLLRALRHATLPALLALLFCPSTTQAAGFDCEKAATAVEKLVCSEEELSELDAKLNTAYQTASSVADASQKKQLVDEQRKWLKSKRNTCTDFPCLWRSYTDRLNSLDPFADDEITCEEMREHPERIFVSGGIDLGSGSGSPIDVDYGCPESLQQQDFMREILDVAEQIRGESGGPQWCSGTIVYAQWRYYAFDLTEAGFNPRGLLSLGADTGQGTNWKDFAARDDHASEGDAAVLRYFRDWSESSPANFALYQRFAAAFDKAFPQLVRLFQRSHGLSRPEAEEIARFSLSLVLDRAASSFPHDLLAPVYPLVASIRDGSFKPDDFTASTSYFGEPELYQALIAALVRGLPPAAIEAIAARMDLSDPAAFGESQESLLSFATGDTRSLEILLRRGYPVDTANEFGKTALFYAIGFSQHDAVRVLLAHGANVNHAYKSAKELRPDGDECFYADLKHTRRTPLMHAAQNSDLAMVKLLLEAGGDPDATDDLGSNAMDFAAMGHNPEIVEYLKTQGLAYGSPKYSAEASPEIEERKLISTFPMPGTVSKLLTVPGRPDVLLAGVRPAGHPTVAGKPGIYLVSVADPAHPAVLSMIPDLYTMDFAMTADGRRAYVMGNGNLGGAPERKYGVAVLDIGDPRAPRILEWIDGDFMAMQLAIDDHTLFLQERDHPPQISRGLLVYDLGGPSPRLQCANPFPSPSAGQRLFAYNFAQTPGQPRLFIADQSGFLMLFDVSHPCEPAKVAAFQNVKPSDLTIDPAGTLVVLTDGLSRYRIDGDLTRVNGYRGNFNPLAANAKTRTVAAGVMADSSQFDVVVFQDGPNGQLVLSQRFRTVDDRWIESLHLSDTGYLYMGWEEGLGIGRIRLP